jgi:hypothetical protein
VHLSRLGGAFLSSLLAELRYGPLNIPRSVRT